MSLHDTATTPYPSHWPECCPPSDAEAAEGVYFRIGKHNPPVTEDFQSQAEKGLARTGDPCQREGLSVLRTLTDAEHLISLNKRLGSAIYRGELNSTHGCSKLTSNQKSPTHTTWWPFAGIDRAALFSVIKG